MKYDYIFYQSKMEYDSLSDGFYFYLETPEYYTYTASIDISKTFSDREKYFLENYCSLKDTSKAFPYNLATGWFFNKNSFRVLLDFQQAKVINYAIDSILRLAKSIEKRNPKFHFGGLAWDVPTPSGDFWDTIPQKRQITLAKWTGGDFGIPLAGTLHDYASYSEGHLQFYKQLFETIHRSYPDAKFISEPYRIYEDWIKLVENFQYASEVTPDLLSQESPGIEFENDKRIFSKKLITKDRVASSTPNSFSQSDNLLLAATAAINGSWFSWYGRFGGTGDMPNYKNITEVPDRLKVIRVLANYENLNHTPLPNRIWDGSTYSSNTAFANLKVIGVLQPQTNKYFVVFLSKDGFIPLPKGEKILSVSKTNDLLIESANGDSDIILDGNQLRTSNTTLLDKAYIVHLR